MQALIWRKSNNLTPDWKWWINFKGYGPVGTWGLSLLLLNGVIFSESKRLF
nr:MAG TPA: hypothetical protein [Bacteriophage sp.]